MTRYNEHSDVKSKFKEIDARLKTVERNQFGGATKDEIADIRTLAAPQNFVVTSEAFLDDTGTTNGRIRATWDAVTSVIDEEFSDVVQDVAQYELWGRPSVSGGIWRRLTASTETFGEFSPLPPGESWVFRVRAISRTSSAPGNYSQEVILTIAGDTDAPPTPSKPILTSRDGVISVQWD